MSNESGGKKMNKEAIEAQTIDRALVEEGLRVYMLRVYNYMTTGLALTGIVAYSVSRSELAMKIVFGTHLFWLVMLAPLGALFFLSARIKAMKASTAQTFFWVYSCLMGLSLATVFIGYTGTNIARVFFITAGVFAAMSFYGYTIKQDLSGFGSFLFMGLVGIIMAMLVNLFLQSTIIHFVTSVVGVLVFSGLTAYDTKAIKSDYLESDAEEAQSIKAIKGALMLYLDFLNIFLRLLGLFGDE